MNAVVKILTWNVQFFAGKNYCFFYDRSDGLGKDWRPSRSDMMESLAGVVEVLRAESADIVLLQEVDVWARRTHYVDQIELLCDGLREGLGALYPYVSRAPYWRVPFVPHPKVMGPAGMHLVTLSKFPIVQSRQVVLPRAKRNFVADAFHIRRKLLVDRVQLPAQFSGQQLECVNVHFEAFPAEPDLLEKQVATLAHVMAGANKRGLPAFAAGDFNLIPPGPAYVDLAQPYQRELYNAAGTEMKNFYQNFNVCPNEAEVTGPERAEWHTFNSNDARIGQPDRTLDYVVTNQKLRRVSARVRRADTLLLSDHLPLIAEFEVLAE